jgi:polysaccharide export outer membrane protein
MIRRDAKIVVPLAGEVTAAGKTPGELEADLLEACGPQLQVKEVRVTVAASGYPVFVSGAVLRPGKLMATRPLALLEAIMESGGFDYTRANVKKVKVIREENGETKTYIINLKDAIAGKETVVFYLRPSDIVFVPERFTLF